MSLMYTLRICIIFHRNRNMFKHFSPFRIRKLIDISEKIIYNRHIFLSIDESDGSIQEITLCHDGSYFYQESEPDVQISLSNAEEENSYKIIDVKNYTGTPGCYTVKVNGVVQERFFKLGNSAFLDKPRLTNNGDITELHIPRFDDFLFVIVNYGSASRMWTVENPQIEVDDSSEISNGKLSLPTYITAADGVTQYRIKSVRMAYRAKFFAETYDGEDIESVDCGTYCFRNDQTSGAFYLSVEV